MNVYGYARVSSSYQKIDPQMKAIKKFCEDRGLSLAKVFSNMTHACEDNDLHLHCEKPTVMENGFGDMMESLRSDPDDVKAVIVTRFVRISHRNETVLKYVIELNDLGVQIISIKEPDVFSDPKVTKLAASMMLWAIELGKEFPQFIKEETPDVVSGTAFVYYTVPLGEEDSVIKKVSERLKKFCDRNGIEIPEVGYYIDPIGDIEQSALHRMASDLSKGVSSIVIVPSESVLPYWMNSILAALDVDVISLEHEGF